MKHRAIKIVTGASGLLFAASVVWGDYIGGLYDPPDPIEGWVGHLAESGPGSGFPSTAWTFARYYGGEFYGGYPDRLMQGYCAGLNGSSQWDHYTTYDYTQSPETYLSTGNLWSASTHTYGWSVVDTDYDNEYDGEFTGNWPEAWAVVYTTTSIPLPPSPF